MPPVNPALPCTSFWNMRYLGISDAQLLENKLENARFLTSRYDVACFQEVRASAAVAHDCFFCHLPGRFNFYCTGPDKPGLAISVSAEFAQRVGMPPGDESASDNHHHVLPDGSCQGLSWVCEGRLKLILNLYLDSHSSSTRIGQLKGIAWDCCLVPSAGAGSRSPC